MMGSLITRALIMLVGYVYPAYKCFKCVEMNRPDVEQLRFWCQYWIIIAVVTVLERLGDAFISWIPLYSEAKLAFIMYLWSPKTLGTTYVYSGFLRPLVATHEGEIDRHLNEMMTRAGDLLFQYWQKGYEYVQSQSINLLQFVASQAPPSRPDQGSVDHAQLDPQTAPPPPGYQESLRGYDVSPQATDYSPSAPVLPSEYLSHQGDPTVCRSAGHGYPQQIAGYSLPPYMKTEQEVPSSLQGLVAQPLADGTSHKATEVRNGYTTRRLRARRQP